MRRLLLHVVPAATSSHSISARAHTECCVQVKAEQSHTATIYAAREAAEAAGAGRIPMEAFKVIISTLQVRPTHEQPLPGNCLEAVLAPQFQLTASGQHTGSAGTVAAAAAPSHPVHGLRLHVLAFLAVDPVFCCGCAATGECRVWRVPVHRPPGQAHHPSGMWSR